MTNDAKFETRHSAPQSEARVGGVLYLVVIITAFFAEMYVRSSLIIDGNPAATARSLLSNEHLYRLGGVADIINLVCDVGVAVVLYRIFWPVGPGLALFAALTRVVADVCLATATLFHFAPLVILKGAPGLDAIGQPQLQSLAYQAIRLHSTGYNISLVFFAIHLFALGWLVLKSAIIPRVIGGLVVLTAICYTVNSLGHLAVPEIPIPFWLLLPGLFSELALAGWLLIRGIDRGRWQIAVNRDD